MMNSIDEILKALYLFRKLA